MSQVLTIDNRDYIPAGKVGKHFGYTRDYILILARDGKIDGRKVGHRWYVNLASTEKYFAAAHVAREERRQVVSEVRRAELRTFTAQKRTVAHGARSLEFVAIALIALVIGVTGYVSVETANDQVSLVYSSDAPFLEKVAVSLYNLITLVPKEMDIDVTHESRATHGQESASTTSPTVVTETELVKDVAPTRIVHTSLVIAPDEVFTSTSIESIRDSFSDDVSVSIDPHNPDTGIIIPHFKDGDGESYRYLMVPVTEGNGTQN